jgi:hypothetical protein
MAGPNQPTGTPAPSPASGAIDTDALIADAGQSLQQASDSVTEHERRQETQDRSQIARIIIWTFALTVGGFFIIAAIMGIVGSYRGVTDWKDAAGLIVEVLKSVLLPVVTLVLGFYFGRQSAGQDIQ